MHIINLYIKSGNKAKIMWQAEMDLNGIIFVVTEGVRKYGIKILL